MVAGHGWHPRRNRVRADGAPVSRLPQSLWVSGARHLPGRRVVPTEPPSPI